MIIIGHRGALGLAPQNTLASLRKAAEHKVDEIEFDVRVTSDDIVILAHDAFITDAAGSKLTIDDHTYEQLLAHKSDLATLRSVIDDIGPKIPLYIEIKPREKLEPIVEQLHYALRSGFKPIDMRLGSFSQKILSALHAEFPDITKVVIESWSGVRAGYRARQLGTKRIAMNQRWLWWGFVGPVSKSGWQLTPYTVNTVKQAKGWQKLGLYGIVTDFPDRFES